MEMSLFLNESYIFHRLRMWSIVLWGSCVFVCAECGNANYRGAHVPSKNPFPCLFIGNITRLENFVSIEKNWFHKARKPGSPVDQWK
ncbi:XXYS1_4_G0050540.mRNA.1.CDS.1 [Saccharomyces cerevisiae]|nr:XXYS1_4_G0050540.mRNA.1.CDS.1 [Saccharomyces cerevisiae]